jgi:N6-L-threonylcarbamoyladenine synthase
MLVLGIETSCDETGVALYDDRRGLLGHLLHTQAQLHAEYGGVVPELASRDHVRRLLPLTGELLRRSARGLGDLTAVAFTEGPGLAGALLVGAATAHGLAYSLGIPAIGVHHLEAHLLSPLLSKPTPAFPFIALLVSGGHTQVMRVAGVGQYDLLGETLDDAAGEAFDKTAKLLGLAYPGGPALARLAERGTPGRFRLPRPMIASGNLDFSFSGLKTAVMTIVRDRPLDEGGRADLAAEIEAAIVEVLAAKALAAAQEAGLERLVVAGGVGANTALRRRLAGGAAARGVRVFYPEMEFCTDNGAMIAFAAALRLQQDPGFRVQNLENGSFTVRPRWDLESAGAR